MNAHVADPHAVDILDDPVRLKAFGAALDDVRRRVEARVGPEDLDRVRRLDRLSRGFEVAGRLLIHLSFEPIGWTAGVLALFVHKQLQATEIGHTALHGAYDHLEGAGRFHSTRFRWDIPIDEASWHVGHNLKHHPYTNVVDRDPDVRFGPVRLNREVPYTPSYRWQLATTAVSWMSFTAGMNLHFTGIVDLFRDKQEVLPDRSWRSIRTAVWAAARKYVPYYAKNYVLFPALAGPFWWKVLAGNAAAELLRDVYSAASIFCGHVGPDVAAYPAGSRPGGRAAWYARQCAATRNFEVPYTLSVLCGGLDHQIEHHLFPKLPPERLREIAPEVRAICEAHGVPYRSGPWLEVLADALGEIGRLAEPDAPVACDALGEAV